MKTGLALGLFVVLTGCGIDNRDPVDVQPEEPLARLDLRAAMNTTTNVTPVGLAIAPGGARFVFDEVLGLYRLDGAVGVPVVRMEDMPHPGPTAVVKPPFTDLVAIAPNLFALTAIGDGYLLDTSAMTLQQHFCYLPDGTPVSLVQRTDAITYDAAAQKLYAQPVTYDAAGVFQYSQVAGYDHATGEDVEWFSAGNDVAATGMIVMPRAGLVLGQGSKLTRFDTATGESIPLDDLARFGVLSIDGLAIDPVTGALVVVDKATDTVFDIALSQLTL